MNPFFSTKQRVANLQREAMSWRGTPFFPNSASKGHGVSCQMLAAEIYRAVGFASLDVPSVAMTHARFQTKSLVEAYLSGRPDFERLPAGSQPMPGDALGFRIGKAIHHIGVVISPGTFVHALDHVGVEFSEIADATWKGRLGAIWRPVE